MQTVLSHRRPTPRSRKITLTLTLVLGIVFAGAIGAPIAFAQGTSWVIANPSRTITAGSQAPIYVRAGGVKPGHQVALHQRQANGSWKAVLVRRLDAKLNVGFYPSPGATTVYRVAVFGTAQVSASYSSLIQVTVLNRGVAVVAEAAKLKGKPYRYGAAGPHAFDCSGYTQFVYKRFGRNLPHSATQQARHGAGVAKNAARPGDLILFGSGSRYYHAAIYAGNGYMWDASTSGHPVALRKIWSNNFVVRRLV